MSKIPDNRYRDFYKMMSQQQILPVNSSPDIEIIRPKPKSILRSILQAYIDEPRGHLWVRMMKKTGLSTCSGEQELIIL